MYILRWSNWLITLFSISFMGCSSIEKERPNQIPFEAKIELKSGSIVSWKMHNLSDSYVVVAIRDPNSPALDFFLTDNNDKKVRFSGMIYEMKGVSRDSFVIIPPHASASRPVDLAEQYDLVKGRKLNVQYYTAFGYGMYASKEDAEKAITEVIKGKGNATPELAVVGSNVINSYLKFRLKDESNWQHCKIKIGVP